MLDEELRAARGGLWKAGFDEGTRVMMVSAWGLTETSPLVTQVHSRIERTGNIAVPARGCELAFVPSGQRAILERRSAEVERLYAGGVSVIAGLSHSYVWCAMTVTRRLAPSVFGSSSFG